MAFKIKRTLYYFKNIVILLTVLNNVIIVKPQLIDSVIQNKTSETKQNITKIFRINSEKLAEVLEENYAVKNASDKSNIGIVDNVSVTQKASQINGSFEEDPILSSLSSFKEGPMVENWTKLSWLMELFDHHKWEERHYQNASRNCSRDMAVYLDALKTGRTWAAKMSDASGRYNGQFFFGNDFWIGSSSLCLELQINLGGNDIPPYPTSFSVAKIQIAINEFSTKNRTILMGICMPSSCSPKDLESILSMGAEEAVIEANVKMAEIAQNGGNLTRDGSNTTQNGVDLQVVLVRPVPGPYVLWNDFKFYLVGGAGCIAVSLILLGSAYEGYVNQYNKRLFGDVETDNNNSANCKGNGSGNGKGSCTKDNTQKEKIGTGILSQILLAFSALSNTEKIMKTEESSEDSINCIHGLRFLSLAWVIMVHTYLQVFTVADNKTLRSVIERNFFYQTVGNASYSVDTFFFISGLLVTFLYYKSQEAKKNALIARKGAKLVAQSAGNANGNHSNGEHSKIQMSQYAYVNHGMATPAHAVIGRSSSAQPMVNLEQFQTANTVFTRQTCTRDVKENVSEFILLLFYRIVRLTPAYLFVIGLNELALRYSHNNSVFDPPIFDHITCDKYWWRNILYINNLFPRKEMCMIWSWYMANDTQFYIIGIILLLIAKRHFKTSATILLTLLVSSWVTTGYISIANDYRAKIQQPFEMFDQLYDKPWSRLGPYLIGMITGYFLWQRRRNLHLPTWVVALGWPGALATMASIVYGMRDGHLELWPTAFYVSIGHTAWSAATAWVVICCVCGRGGIVSRALSYRGALPLSRLAYCAYLVHPTIMMLSTLQMDGPIHMHNGIVLIIYAGNTVMSYLMSFAISIAFEAPVVRLLKINFRNSKNKRV